LMRCFERMIRRAALPVRSTQGFNPKPRLVFALSLGLGIAGCQEVVELELDRDIDPGVLFDRLAVQAPVGLTILSVTRIDPRAQAVVKGARYRIEIPPDRLASVNELVEKVIAAPHSWIDRVRPRE